MWLDADAKYTCNKSDIAIHCAKAVAHYIISTQDPPLNVFYRRHKVHFECCCEILERVNQRIVKNPQTDVEVQIY